MPVLGPYDGQSFPKGNLTAFPGGVIEGSIARNTVVYKLTSAQLLALPTPVVQLVAAPGLPPHGLGSSLVLVPGKAIAQYIYNTTAYTLGNADNVLQIEYTGKSTALVKLACAGLVDQVVNEVVAKAPEAAGNIAQTNVANLGLELTITGTTPALTLGDGTVIITLDYTIVVLGS